jgi:hypothetical protein
MTDPDLELIELKEEGKNLSLMEAGRLSLFRTPCKPVFLQQ